MTNTNDAPCPLEVREAMDAVLSYSWPAEERDYEENEAENHVFLAMQRVNDWLNKLPPVGPDYVHVVEVLGREDGTYVFADLDDARAFEETVNGDPTAGASRRCFRHEEVVCDHADALKLIEAEREEVDE
jgi:hypothetical protein